MTDLVVALFVALLVVAGLEVPRWGDAFGRLLRRSARAADRGEAGPGAPPPAEPGRRDG